MSSRHSRLGALVLALIGLLHLITLAVREVGHEVKELGNELPSPIQKALSATVVALGRSPLVPIYSLLGALIVVVVLAIVYRARISTRNLDQSATTSARVHSLPSWRSWWIFLMGKKVHDRVAHVTPLPVSQYSQGPTRIEGKVFLEKGHPGRDDLAIALAVIRTIRQMSQSELASAAGVPRGAISDYESGRVDPQTQTVFKLLRGLDLPAAILDQTQAFIETVRSQVGGQVQGRPDPASPASLGPRKRGPSISNSGRRSRSSRPRPGSPPT
jgi:transcriptional regulator with XRE-family HTH domain